MAAGLRFSQMKLSKPESSGILQKRDESSMDMAGHDGFDPTQELAPNKHCRDCVLLAIGTGKAKEKTVNVTAINITVELDNGRAYSKAKKKLLHDVAHAATADGEYDHRIAGDQMADPVIE